MIVPDAPPELITVPADGVNTADALIVNVPATLKLADAVTVADAVIAIPLNVRVPLLAIAAPLLNVIVPLVGANVVLPLTVSVPPTLKLAVG